MQLTLWTYEGPPHIGAMRVATAMHGLHYVLHAPQGDTYADLLFTMIERRDARPPVTYTTFRAQDLGRDTAELFKTSVAAAYARFQPQAMIVGASCTAELIQDDPGGLAKALDLPIPVIPLELPAYQKKENWGASETFYRLVRALAGPASPRSPDESRQRPLCNILGPTALGFRHRDDLIEIRRLLETLGIASTWWRRSAPARPISADSRMPTSTSCSTRRPPAAPPNISRRVSGSRSPRKCPSGSAPRTASWRRSRLWPVSIRRRSSTGPARACPGTRARSIRPT